MHSVLGVVRAEDIIGAIFQTGKLENHTGFVGK